MFVNARLRLAVFALLLTQAANCLAQEQRGQYGDVQILKSDHIRGNLTSATVTGSSTIVIVPDTDSGSVLRLHADTIVMKKQGNATPGTVDLTGHVTYHVVQKTDDGERTIDGTAGHGFYSKVDSLIVLTEGVRGTLTQPDRLAEPATYHVASARIQLAKEGNHYRMVGGPNASLRFTPKEAASKSRPKPKTLGNVNVINFESGDLTVGERAVFRGPDTAATYFDPSDGSEARFQSPRVSAAFTVDHTALSRITGTGTVRYALQRPNAEKTATRGVTGTAALAVYSVESGDLTLTGAVDARISDTTGLARPAKLTAKQVVASRRKDGGYQYDLMGEAGSRLDFTPKPKQPDPAAPPPPPDPFPIGDVSVTDWASGTFDPGKSFVFKGDNVSFTTRDAAARTRTHFLAARVTGTLSAQNEVTGADVTGNVRYSAERPSRAPKAAPTSMEAISGTATRGLFRNAGNQKLITLEGPLQAQLTDPENLEKPGVIEGKEGDSVILNLAASPYEFETVTPHQTITIVMQPKQHEKPPATPVGKRK